MLFAQLCLSLCDFMNYNPLGFSFLLNSLGKNTGVGCHAPFQGIFLTQEIKPVSPAAPSLQAYSLLLSHWGGPK